MRELKEIEAEIEKLRVQLNFIAKTESSKDRIPTPEKLLLSQQMDGLINEYQQIYYK